MLHANSHVLCLHIQTHTQYIHIDPYSKYVMFFISFSWLDFMLCTLCKWSALVWLGIACGFLVRLSNEKKYGKYDWNWYMDGKLIWWELSQNLMIIWMTIQPWSWACGFWMTNGKYSKKMTVLFVCSMIQSIDCDQLYWFCFCRSTDCMEYDNVAIIHNSTVTKTNNTHRLIPTKSILGCWWICIQKLNSTGSIDKIHGKMVWYLLIFDKFNSLISR